MPYKKGMIMHLPVALLASLVAVSLFVYNKAEAAGVVVPLSPTWSVSAGAAYEMGADRSGVSGNISTRYQF